MISAIWEPHVPVVGRRYRVRVSPECNVLLATGTPHGEIAEAMNGDLVTVVKVFQKTTFNDGHRVYVRQVQDASLTGYLAAIELEPLDDEGAL